MRDKTVEHLRSALRAVAYAGHEDALREYRAELERMPGPIAATVRGAAVDIAAISRTNPGKARRVVDELAAKIAAELTEPAPSRSERDASAALADRLRGSTSGAYASSDDGDRRRAARARDAVDQELAGQPVPWRQD